MAPTDIPQFIHIYSMTKSDRTTQDDDDDTSVNTNSVHVSVTTLGTKQTCSTNKSVVPVDSPATRSSKAKRCRTQSSFYSPETSSKSASPSKSPRSTTAKRKLDPVLDESDDDGEYFSDAEKKFMVLKEKVKNDQFNTPLVKEMQAAEKDFYKTLISFNLRTGPAIKWQGWVQGYIQTSSLTTLGEQYQKTERGKRCEVLKKALKKETVGCNLCWHRDDRTIHNCLVSLVKQNISNALTHLTGKHFPEEYPALANKSAPVALKQNLISDFKSQGFQQGSSKEALTFLYRFFNDANIAIDQSNNSNLRKFVSYIIDNASYFQKRKQECYFSKYKYKKYEVGVFHDFLSLVSRLIGFTRQHYNNTLQISKIPFLYIAHDGWDSHDYDILGVSIHFVLPVAWIPISLSVGLQRISSKTSDYTSRKILEMLERYGITVDDINRGINDTTNSALKTGLTISGGRKPSTKGTTCYMHAQELVVVHALGLRTRKKKGQKDEFPEGKNLRDKVRILLSKIMDKKAKQRYERYGKYCKEHYDVDTIKLLVPNETRVSGVFGMYQSALRSKKLITAFTTRSSDAPTFTAEMLLDDGEWKHIAETYTILQTTNLLAMTSQEDSVDSNCFSYFQVAQARHLLKTNDLYRIIDVSEHWTPATDVKKIPSILKTKDAMLPASKALITRLVTEFNRYFEKPDSDQIIMMVLNPLMFWGGFSYLKIYDRENFNTATIDGYCDDVVTFLFNMFSKSFEDNYIRDPIVDAADAEAIIGTDDIIPGMEDIDDFQMLVYKQLQEEKVIRTHETKTIDLQKKLTDLKKKLENILSDYRDECENMNMTAWLDEHGNKKYELEKKNNSKVLLTKLKFKDAGYITKFFNVLQWWKVVGRNKYGELGIAASIFLGKPTHNAFQERVFSRGTYTDTKLKKRLKEENFEMSVLNAFNGKRIDEIKELLNQEQNWNVEKNAYIPNKTQAREVMQFFKESNVVEIISEKTPAVVPPNDDDTISEGSEKPFLLGDDDDTSLEDFLSSNAFLNENEPDEAEIVTLE